jgi:hypothetical protein
MGSGGEMVFIGSDMPILEVLGLSGVFGVRVVLV